MTPNWVTLVVAGLGLVGTLVAGLGGVLITQRGTRRTALLAERARTFDERRAACLEVVRAVDDLFAYVRLADRGRLPQTDEDARREASKSVGGVTRSLVGLRIFGGKEVSECGARLAKDLVTLSMIVGLTKEVRVDATRDEFVELVRKAEAGRAELIAVIRRDLGVDERGYGGTR